MSLRMTRKSLALIVAAAVVPTTALAGDTRDEHGRPEPPMAGIHWAKGQQPPARPGAQSPNLTGMAA